MKTVFIAGTDTGSGKTVVTGLLARYMSMNGRSVVTQKWAGTGRTSDIDAHIRLLGKRLSDFAEVRSAMAPYHFTFASSPHLAARLEGRRIDPGRIKRSFRSLSKRFDVVIAEGVGGLLVPLRDDLLVIDIVKDLDLPVVLVAANKLGAINQALLSLEALRARKIRVVGTIFNNAVQEKKVIQDDNPRTVKKFGKVDLLGVLPYANDIRTLDKYFQPIGDRITKHHE
jgi:dethiobiotin synthetase